MESLKKYEERNKKIELSSDSQHIRQFSVLSTEKMEYRHGSDQEWAEDSWSDEFTAVVYPESKSSYGNNVKVVVNSGSSNSLLITSEDDLVAYIRLLTDIYDAKVFPAAKIEETDTPSE